MNEANKRESWMNLKVKEEWKRSECLFQINRTCPSLALELKTFSARTVSAFSTFSGRFLFTTGVRTVLVTVVQALNDLP